MILSAGAVVVRKEKGEWKFLFLRAFKNWDFPKGIVEPGEDPMDTARREVEEETGIQELHFRWGDVYKETVPYASGGKKIARYYIAETPQTEVTFSINPEIGKPEHQEYRWVSADEVKKLAPSRLLGIIGWAEEVLLKEMNLEPAFRH